MKINKKNQRLLNKRRKFFIGFFVFWEILIFVNFLYAQNCKYDKNGFREVPWGHIRSEADLGEVRRIRGKVLGENEEKLFGVRIALYKIEDEKKLYIGSQTSDKEGNFCFKGLNKGKYELLMGLEGFNSRIFYLKLNPNDKTLSNKIVAYLEVGT